MLQSYAKGKYAGLNRNELSFGGILLSQTVYRKDTVSDWHYHEHPYFAMIMNGGSTEVRRSGSIECLTGRTYFYNWQDAHRNKDYQEGSRNFNIEFDKDWLTEQEVSLAAVSGILSVNDPAMRLILVRLFREYTINDPASALSIEAMALELVSLLHGRNNERRTPPWVGQIEAILNDRWSENISLQELSRLVNIHPVSISRHYRKYFGCTLGEYVRRLRIARAIPLVKDNRLALTAIALECGFADQSHFIRTFKEQTRFLPHHFRKA